MGTKEYYESDDGERVEVHYTNDLEKRAYEWYENFLRRFGYDEELSRHHIPKKEKEETKKKKKVTLTRTITETIEMEE